MISVTFTDLTQNQKLEVADLLQKQEAIDGLLADVQTERATAEQGWRDRENSLRTERMKVQMAVRGIRTATMG